MGRVASLNTGLIKAQGAQERTLLRDEKFRRDLDSLLARLSPGLPEDILVELEALKEKLIWLHAQGRAKINHSVMELVCAKELLLMGYLVDVEYEIGQLVCDVYAEMDGEGLVIEIETGFVPPEHALDPLTYCRARIVSKIARYGSLAERFALGLPPHYVASIPPLFLKEGRERTEEEISKVKTLCDYYYHNPPVSEEEIRSARLDWVLIIDADSLSVSILSPKTYHEISRAFLSRVLPGAT